MKLYLIMLVVALVISAIGFYKYVYFISLGYGFSVAAIGVALLWSFRDSLTIKVLVICLLFIVYGCRLSGYLLIRELKSATYRSTMKKEIKDGKEVSFPAKIAIWITCGLLYACQTSPVLFRLENGKTDDTVLLAGILIMCMGIILESVADVQKSAAKKENPNRFVDTGLFKIVRCPNYFGEMVFWTGVLVSGVNVMSGVLQWVIALSGYLGIIYVMFSGARRLELRQNRNYGKDPEYQEYVKKTPIMVPLIPLYSVADQKWLVG